MVGLYHDPEGKNVFNNNADNNVKGDLPLSSTPTAADSDESTAALKARVKKMEEVMQSIGIDIN